MKQPCQDDPLTEAVVAKFPVNISVYSDLGPMLKEVDQLIFPKDEDLFSQIGASRVIDLGLMGRAALVASEKKLSDTDDMLVDALEKLDKATDEAVIQTNGKLMNQDLLGETDSWRLENVIEIWEQWRKLKKLKQAEDQKDEVDTVGQSGKDAIGK
ncbi:hypothetical protein Ddye_023224 [Dipteronia dyeriana]|uniref:Uncharacterized protein n=1 Tax=Dipteronia dyeriana TaxID=168575 RepID=A0AAD9WSE2_9ROSI|nr:hypothetical protein Ddye_023224 [Dipteronia dyeriana]